MVSVKNYVLTMLLLLTGNLAASQSTREVSITIDDIPNAELYRQQNFSSALLRRIDSLRLPVAIFTNERLVYSNEFTKQNREGLERWLRSKNITAGNHSYSHMNYGDTTLMAFQEDIVKGEIITRETIGKSPLYFRFPYNALGKDEEAHDKISKFLKSKQYILTPYTIESEDWAFNPLYEEALKNGDTERAAKVAQNYIAHTLAMFDHFEKVSADIYGRNIKHIYLCHDNKLNTDHLVELVTRLRGNGYDFITLEQALKDKVYRQKDHYDGNYGYSWIYRWMKDEAQRKKLMQSEPVNNGLK